MMTQPHKFHLFNCDSIYELSVVEDLLKATKAKLGFEFSVEKHNFTLSEMSELSTKTIREMQIDFAMFVVHAHESVLAINNDNLEYGYSKVYRALLQATGEKVIVVIGGDDNYKNETEEEQSVISRWASRKIAHPQFSAEFIDGRKSFVFSWDKKHREIHEEALLHYFDPNKKGQKFEHQPKPSPLQPAQSVTEQRTTDSSFSPYNSAEQRREDSSGSNISTAMANMKFSNRKQGARPREVPPSSTGTDWAILGCNVSNDSMQAVRKVIQAIAPKLNLSESPPVENLPPDEAKRYLTRNKLKCCVLVVDAETINDAHKNLPKRKVEYKELLETAADKVDKKVIILVCDTCSLPPKDEAIVNETIERIVNKRQKVFTAWLKHGRLTADPDVLVQFLISPSPAPQPNPHTILSGDFQESPRVAPVSTADSQGVHTRNPFKSETGRGFENAQSMQQLRLQEAEPIPSPVVTVINGGIVKLKSMLRYGVISRQSEDLQIWDPQFKVPDYIRKYLYEKYRDTSVAGVRIVLGENGQLSISVDPKLKESSWRKGLQIAANETLMLKTRLRYGLVSFQENDVQYFKYGNGEIPRYIVDSLKQEYLTTACADLCIFLDNKGDLRWEVKIGNRDRVLNFPEK